MSKELWGHINYPSDSNTLLEHLSNFKDIKKVVMCELGVATGRTANRMVEHLKAINVKNVKYYGVDTLWLDQLLNVKDLKPHFEYEEMEFIEGDRTKLSSLPKLDFGFVDACHCAECVYHDSIAMSKKIKKNGTMAFHDTSLLWQYPNGQSQLKDYWQHIEGAKVLRPMGVVEGIMMSRAKWDGEWNLIKQTGDDLVWGGIRIYQRVS
jgi:hypothetical protein